MTNWKEKTDFEINKAVAEIVSKSSFDASFDAHIEFNPCKNPSDAWQIIVQNKISIMNDGDTWEASIDFDGDLEKHGTDETLSKYYEDKNPLRAAMIAFLMIYEDKK